MTYRTCIAHDSAWYFLVTAMTTEDLATYTAVMTPSERIESIPTFIALATVAIWHPVLAEIAVFVCLWCLKSMNVKNRPWEMGRALSAKEYVYLFSEKHKHNSKHCRYTVDLVIFARFLFYEFRKEHIFAKSRLSRKLLFEHLSRCMFFNFQLRVGWMKIK